MELILELLPSNIKALNSLAQYHAEHKNNEKAINLYENSLKLAPKNIDTHDEFASFYYEIEEYDKAIELYQKAIDLAPKLNDYANNHRNIYRIESFYYMEYFHFLYDIAMAYYKKKDYKNAIEIIEQYNALPFEDSIGYNLLGRLYVELDNYNDAVKYLRKSLLINPEDSYPWINIAHCYIKLERYKQAIHPCKMALKYNENQSSNWNQSAIWAHLGFATYNLGKIKKAIEYIEISKDLKPIYPRVWYYQALIHLDKGQKDDALKTWKKCLNLIPDHKNAKELLKRIKERYKTS